MNSPTAGARRTLQIIPAIIILLLPLAGCSGEPENVRRYDLKGKVVSVNREKGVVGIDHEEVKDFMSAMKMDFTLKDADALKVVEVGDTIQATLVVADSGYWLESPAITKPPVGAASPSEVAGMEPTPGAEVPEARLVNQDGKKISTRQFKGRALLVTFIYTRCPFPDQCPLMSANFAQLNGELAKDAGLRAGTHLLSVTLDPEYDKPEVLRAYGATYAGGKFDNWDFATGDPDEIRRLAHSFGLAYKAENGQVIHSLRTALVTPEGKLAKIYRGNEWKPSEVLEDLKGVARRQL